MNRFESLRKNLEDRGNYTDLLELVEVISYNSFYLDWLIVHDMEEFNELMEGLEPLEIADKIENGNFNSNEDLFHYNDNGELVSYTECDYEEYVYDSIDYIEEDIELIVRDSKKNNDLRNIIKDLNDNNVFKQILISLEDFN
jgi:hypothetical protein